MKKTLFSFAVSCLLLSCANEEGGPITKKTVSNFSIRDCYTTSNGNNFLIYEQNNKIGAFSVTTTQLDSLRELPAFNIEVHEQNGNSSAHSISTNNVDTTGKTLYFVEANDIEDYKRKTNGSYTIIEKDGLFAVCTPNQEISNMLRLESFRFYYFRNWDGKYYFDHIEEE